MKKTVTYCDHCGATECSSFRVGVGTFVDPCDGTTVDYADVDLCPKCCAAALTAFLVAMETEGSTYAACIEWVKKWKTRKEGVK